MNELKKIVVLTILISFLTSVLVAGLITGLSEINISKKLSGLSPQIIRQEITKNEPGVKYLPQTSSEEKTIEVVKKTDKSVVSIIASKDLPVVEQFFTNPFEGTPNEEFFKQFFEEFQTPQFRQKGTEKKQVSAGTGFIISSDGMILTNKHVVSLEDVEYTVLTNDGEKHKAKVLAKDPIQDLAIVKIEKTGLPYLILGDSDKIQVGQNVIAIGNALGEFENTVSVGVISGLRRNITASGGGATETFEDIIQTDAAINQGNSGGPLLNLNGEVIGINTAMVSGAQNIGFAIPINKANKAVNDVKTKGRIIYPFLGVRYMIITKEIADKNNLSVDYGAWIIRGDTPTDPAITPGSPAQKAGLKENDIILEFDGVKITAQNNLAKLISQKSVGDTITLKVLKDGKETTVKATLSERKG